MKYTFYSHVNFTKLFVNDQKIEIVNKIDIVNAKTKLSRV